MRTWRKRIGSGQRLPPPRETVFRLDFKFKNGGKSGNGGVALRAPLAGDPAYSGLELLEALPGAQRPRRGHIAFPDLSESGEMILFRNVQIAELN